MARAIIFMKTHLIWDYSDIKVCEFDNTQEKQTITILSSDLFDSMKKLSNYVTGKCIIDLDIKTMEEVYGETANPIENVLNLGYTLFGSNFEVMLR